MYLSSKTQDIIRRTKHLAKLEMKQHEWWLICFLGTDQQNDYVNMYIHSLKESIKSRNKLCI